MRIHDAHPILSERVSERLYLDAMTKSGGQTLSGREQVIFSPLPLWRAEISPVLLEDDDDAWRAWLAKVGGRSSAIRFGVLRANDDLAALNARFGVSAPYGRRGLPFESGRFFSSGVGFRLSVPRAGLASQANAFSTVIQISLNGLANGFRDGDKIGIGGNFYVVTAVSGTTLEIAPPLRKTVAAGAEVTLSPTIVMQLTTDDQGWAVRNGGNPLMSPTLNLVELPELI